jgi:hypothetical protein
LLLQDYDPTDDTSPYPPTDGRNATRDPVWEEYNDSSNWLYFQVDESISGEPMADPEDPGPTPSEQVGAMGLVAKIILGLVLVFIGLAMVYFIVTNFMSGRRTVKEMFDMFKMLFFGLIVLGVCAVLIALF